jgi:hypothetical protein
MRRRRGALGGLTAVTLGAAAALLVACGSSGKGLIPVASSEPLQSDFQEVAQAAAAGSGDCTATEKALEKLQQDYGKLPPSVDAGLRARLREGIETLHAQALSQCSQASTNTSSTAKTNTTQTVTTNTTPTQTTTTTTTPTQTETTTTPTQTTTTGGGAEAPSEDSGNGNGDGGGPSGGVAPPGQGGVPPGQEGR